MNALGDQSVHPVPTMSQNQSSGETTVHEAVGGLTKRELFAAMAMQGVLAVGTGSDRFDRAREAIAHADALLAELAK